MDGVTFFASLVVKCRIDLLWNKTTKHNFIIVGCALQEDVFAATFVTECHCVCLLPAGSQRVVLW